MKRMLSMMLVAIPLGACVPGGGATGARPAISAAPFVPIPAMGSANDQVVGMTQSTLTGLFGPADATVTEGAGTKMQFASGVCVLDAYLYPPKAGGVPSVTYFDTRQRNGGPIDRASCVAALKRRDGGK